MKIEETRRERTERLLLRWGLTLGVWLSILIGVVLLGAGDKVGWVIGFASLNLLITFFGHPKLFGDPSKIEDKKEE